MRMKDIFAIAMCVLAGTIAMMGATAPTSRLVGYRVAIEAKESANVKVLATSNYIVTLESGPCALTVRHLYLRAFAPAQLLWNANFDLGTYEDATQCTMTLTTGGDLQL